jgi:hypothetical protein
MTTECACVCHDYPKIITHDRACCEYTTQWRCSEKGCASPFANVMQYYTGTDPLGPATALCVGHRSLGSLRVGDQVAVSSVSKGAWTADKINVRVSGGSYRSLLIESDCPTCKKPSSTDHGGGNLPEDFTASFRCETCGIEWGCDVRLSVIKRD